jgi:hypothetical protein
MERIVARFLSRTILVTAFCLGPAVAASFAADSKALKAAFDQMLKPELSATDIYRLDTLTITQKDFSFRFSRGLLVFLAPVTLDSSTLTYGALFLDDPATPGEALFQFQPTLPMEQEQIRRFLKTDSLNRKCPSALFLFNQSMGDQLKAGLEKATIPKLKIPPKLTLKERWSPLAIKEDYAVPFAAFKNLVAPRSKPFLAVSVPGDHAGDLVYVFDPYQREEVSLLKKYREAIVDLFLETVCRYSVYADITYERLNGIDKDEIRILHYALNGSINGGGRYTGSAAMKLAVEIDGTRLLYLELHPRLQVDSIFDASGKSVPFVRWTREKNRSYPLYLFLDEPLKSFDTTSLTFYYHGEIAKAQVGVFLVTAASGWYPHYSYRDAATFDMTFSTPSQYAFVATGERVDSQLVGDAMVTKWRITTPTAWATFNLGTLAKYSFAIESGRVLDIYFNEQHHKAMAIQNVYHPTTLEQAEDTTKAIADWKDRSIDPSKFAAGMGVAGSHMEKQVAGDVIESFKLLSSLFGLIPERHLTATDLTQLTSSAYPGFVALSYATFFNSDPFGSDQLHRAHETAHQWWGVGVRWDTYHDQWLSEGFAEYAALLYLQRAGGNDKLMYWLDKYRKDVATLNKYLFKTRQQAGPIALGYRTSTTQSPDDYDLIVYEKGAYVLHMLRGLLLNLDTYSDSAFYGMLREFHTLYRDRFATTRDFKALTEKYTGIDMTWFFNQWVYGNTIPTYTFSYRVEQDSAGKYLAHCQVAQSEVAPDFKMPVPIEIRFKAGGSAWIRQWIDKPKCEFTIPIEGEPKEIIFNPMHFVLAEVKD